MNFFSPDKQPIIGGSAPSVSVPAKDSLKVIRGNRYMFIFCFTTTRKLQVLAQVNKQKDQPKTTDFLSKSQPNSSASSSSYTSSTNSDDGKMTNSPPMKRIKCDSKNMIDVCVGTSIGTITEPDCLGPCEPGTSVTLEGIVWHETEGGVLAVNVTWRGKTYVGTLIDCTKHDWAPPRFCDSPSEELDSRLPKGGRGKRGRNSVTTTNDLLNFTETRSSVSFMEFLFAQLFNLLSLLGSQ